MISSKYLTRRDFLKLTSISATGLFLASCGIQLPPPFTPSNTRGSKIIQPKVIASRNGELNTAFVVKVKNHTLPGQKTSIKLRTYGSPKAGISAPDPDNDEDWDWSFPGPTLRIKPLDTVKIKLYNRLPLEENPGECNLLSVPTDAPAGTPAPTPFPMPEYPECFHANNVTNLHFHGFHVDQGPRPDGKFGDDVLLALYPKGQQQIHNEPGIHSIVGEVDYEFVVPEEQSPGTHWYHPHNHGSTNLQVANGLSGVFIVEDTLNDQFPGEKPKEYVLVIQDIAESVEFGYGGGNSFKTLINGQDTPNIPMKAGEVQRWRLVNATGKGSNIYNINFIGKEGEKPEIYLIAADGIFIDNEQWDNESPVDGVYMAPGNRIDFLVKANKEGDYSLSANSVQTKRPDAGDGSEKNNSTATPPPDAPGNVNIISTSVRGIQTPEMNLPEKLPKRGDVLRPILDSEIVKKDTVKFSIAEGTKQGQAPIFQIDGKGFEPCFVGHSMVVNTAEEWKITNSSTLAHPFHIHLNPFYIKEFSDPNGGLPDPGRRWQDTIIIPPAKSDGTLGYVVIRHRFPKIVDKFVIHCHILGHEDRGMMQVVEVVAKAGENTIEPTCK